MKKIILLAALLALAGCGKTKLQEQLDGWKNRSDCKPVKAEQTEVVTGSYTDRNGRINPIIQKRMRASYVCEDGFTFYEDFAQ